MERERDKKGADKTATAKMLPHLLPYLLPCPWRACVNRPFIADLTWDLYDETTSLYAESVPKWKVFSEFRCH